MKGAIVAVLGLVMFGTACSKDGTPTTTAPTTTTVAEATVTENFAGTLPVGGSRFYSFSFAQSGTVNITLLRVSGQDVPDTVLLALGLGIPAGTGCSVSSAVSVAAGETPQITGTYNPGVYCARIADPGNLSSAAAFSIDIAHP